MSSIRLTLAAAAVLALAAIPQSSAARQDAGPSAVVDMTFGLRFVPAEVRVRAGQSVEWRNKGFLSHTVTFDPALAGNPANVTLPAGVAPFDSGTIAGGATWRHTFTVPGTYRYVCKPHEDHAMVGVVIVLP